MFDGLRFIHFEYINTNANCILDSRLRIGKIPYATQPVPYITIYRDIIHQKKLVDLAEIEHTFESSNKFARGFSIRSSIFVVE